MVHDCVNSKTFSPAVLRATQIWTEMHCQFSITAIEIFCTGCENWQRMLHFAESERGTIESHWPCPLRVPSRILVGTRTFSDLSPIHTWGHFSHSENIKTNFSTARSHTKKNRIWLVFCQKSSSIFTLARNLWEKSTQVWTGLVSKLRTILSKLQQCFLAPSTMQTDLHNSKESVETDSNNAGTTALCNLCKKCHSELRFTDADGQHPKIGESKKWKFNFFYQRHALSMNFNIFVITYRETNFLPKLVDMLLFSPGKKLNFFFFFFSIPYFSVLPADGFKSMLQFNSKLLQ